MKKLFYFFCLFLLLAIFKVNAQYVPQTAGGYQFKGLLADTLMIPTGCGEPVGRVNVPYRHAAIYFDSCGGCLYTYNPSTAIWACNIGSGSDSAAVTNIFKLTGGNEVYKVINGDTSFAFMDELGNFDSTLFNNILDSIIISRLDSISITDSIFQHFTDSLIVRMIDSLGSVVCGAFLIDVFKPIGSNDVYQVNSSGDTSFAFTDSLGIYDSATLARLDSIINNIIISDSTIIRLVDSLTANIRDSVITTFIDSMIVTIIDSVVHSYQLDSFLNVRCHDTSFRIYPAVGGNTYTNSVLINHDVHLIFRNRLTLLPGDDYGFNWQTGTILFAATVNPQETFLIHAGCFPDTLNFSVELPDPLPPDTVVIVPPPAPPPDDTTSPAGTRFGSALSSGPNGVRYTTDQRIAVAQDLGIRYIRGSTALSTYTLRDQPLDKYIANNFRPVWNLNWEDGGSGRTFANPTAFANKMTEFLNKYAPYLQDNLVVIYNEETNRGYFVGARTPYIALLQAAVDVADDFNVPVTNGGLSVEELYYKVAEYFKDNSLTDSLNWWTNLTFEPNGMLQALNGSNNSFAERMRIFDTLFNAYAAMSNLTYINFHIYYDATHTSPVNTIVLKYISKWVYDNSGKQFITNETGQRREEAPATVERMLNAFRNNNLPYAIWWSGIDPPSIDPRPLSNDDLSLRPNGLKFQELMAAWTP